MGPTEGPDVVPRSPGDKLFRDAVAGILDSHPKRVIVITGEAGSYIGLLREKALRVLDDAEDALIYANVPDPKAVVEMEKHGALVHVGEIRSWDHYFVADDTVAVSVKESAGTPSKTGSRHAQIYRHDPEMAAAVRAFHGFLAASPFEGGPTEAFERASDMFTKAPQVARTLRVADALLQAAKLEAKERTDLLTEIRARLAEGFGPITSQVLTTEMALQTLALKAGR